jgi:enamine deaminase RidA (YjgF/YER057c/UK114 family)
MSTNTLKRAHVGKRLSEYAVYNGVVYLAGQVPEVDPKADLRGQTREVLGHIDRLLAEAGSDKTRILMCQIFLTDIAHRRDERGGTNGCRRATRRRAPRWKRSWPIPTT